MIRGNGSGWKETIWRRTEAGLEWTRKEREVDGEEEDKVSGGK